MSSSVDLKAFVGGFVLEAEENLHLINRNLVLTAEATKHDRPEPRAVAELFRSFHTIKGLASMVGAEPIVEITHEVESLLRTADRAGGRISGALLDLVLHAARAIEERVRGISKEGVGGIPRPSRQLMEALMLAQGGSGEQEARVQPTLALPDEILRVLSASDREQVIQASSRGRRSVVVEFRPSPEKAAQGLNISVVRERLGKLGELVKVIPRSLPEAPAGISFSLLLVTAAEDTALAEACGGAEDAIQEVGLLEQKAAEPEPVPGDHSSIRVDVRRLDEALERLSALIVTRSKLGRVAAELKSRGVDTRELDAVIAENTRNLRRLRAAITESRMVPVSELLQRIPLIVRGLTRNSTKAVNVTVQAGAAEVDKSVADKILPAIVHLVRNAVDHAIESREERRRAGKPESGTLSVVCDDSSGTNLVLRISDDGRGISREAVARKADRVVARTDDELLKQITMPGLSTSQSLTHTSGRGLGMDIVSRAIETLGGVLSLSTVEGKGTTFTLRVPVSVTIMDVLSFVAGGQVFVAPVAMVDEIIEVNPARVVRTPAPSRDSDGGDGGGEGIRAQLVERRGEAIPLLALSALLAADSKPGSGAPSPKALVVNQGRGTIALGVDRMLGQQEVVVRPLDDALVKGVGLSGATDLGDGKPTLVLDLAELGMSVSRRGG